MSPSTQEIGSCFSFLSFVVTLTSSGKSSASHIYRRQVGLNDSKVSLIFKLSPSYLYKEQRLWVWVLKPIAWAQILVLPLTICVTSGEWLNFMNLSHLCWKMDERLSPLNRVVGLVKQHVWNMSMYVHVWDVPHKHKAFNDTAHTRVIFHFMLVRCQTRC